MSKHRTSQAKGRPFTGLPVQLTSFIGREQEIADVRQLLGTTRLLTLMGAGGCGKTRLALQVASQVADQFKDRVAWVELASVLEPALVPQTVATALGVPESPRQGMMDTLSNALRSRQLLLVLDNCEHLIGACRHLTVALLSVCHSLTVLATSREALACTGEMAWLVPSMSTPEALDANTPSDPAPTWTRYDAVQLFVDRAMSALPTFKLTDANAAAIVRVCQRLDGIPLAIELAATRVNVLTVSQLAARLDDRFNLLTAGVRTTLPRHQTLRAAIDWSYDLLSEKEQALFRRLAVFVGGFTLEAAEAICAGEVGQAALVSAEILELLSHLIGKSLVVADTLHGDEARYHLLETIRQYAWDKVLEASEEQIVRKRHRDWYLGLAELAEPELEGSQQLAWMNRLEVEHDNLRTAFDFGSTDQEDTETRLQFAGALRIFWHLRGYWSEGRGRLARALAEACEETSACARALNGAGLLAWDQAEYAPALTFFEKSLALWRKLDHKAGIATSLNYLGAVAWRQGEYAAARVALEEALTVGREASLPREVALSLGLLGVVAREERQYPAAMALLEESISMARKLDLKWVLADSLDTLGGVLRLQKNYERATAVLEESLAISRELGNRWGMSFSLGKLGLVALEQGDGQHAIRLLKDSLILQHEIGDKRGMAYSLEGLARAAVMQHQDERAACVFGAAEALRESIGAPLPPAAQAEIERDVATLRARLNEQAFAVAWADGCAMKIEQTIAVVLADPTSHGPALPALRIFALGSVRVYRGDTLLTSSEWVYAKAKELLFYLLTHAAATKGQIGLDLWPEASPTQLRKSLSVTLHHLRNALGHSEWILFENGHYRFNRSQAFHFWYDVDAFQSNVTRAQQIQSTQPVEAVRLLEQATALYQGSFLDDLKVGDWYLAQREELQRRYREALLMVGHLHLAGEEYSSAADAFRQVITQEPYLEEAYRELMRCYARQGELGQALRHYQRLVDLMQTELGAQPGPETMELVERLRRGAQI